MKRGQTLLVTYTAFRQKLDRPGTRQGLLLVVYSTDSSDYGNVLYQDIFVPTTGTPGGGPHVRVFDGYKPEVDQKGIIAILIGLLLPANNGEPKTVPLPSLDALSAEIHDPSVGIALLVPAVQKIREAAAR